MKTKKLISLVLAVILLFALVPFTFATATDNKPRLEFLTDAIYDIIDDFTDDELAYVRQGLQFGYIDKTGEMVV